MNRPDLTAAIETVATWAFLSGYVRRSAVPDPAAAAEAWEARSPEGREPYLRRAAEYVEPAADQIGAAYIRAAARHLFPAHATPRTRLEALADELDPQETR